MQWLGANLFLLLIVLTGAALFAVWGAIMWVLGLTPDTHPRITILGALLALAGTWALMRWLYGLIDRRRRNAR